MHVTNSAAFSMQYYVEIIVLLFGREIKGVGAAHEVINTSHNFLR